MCLLSTCSMNCRGTSMPKAASQEDLIWKKMWETRHVKPSPSPTQVGYGGIGSCEPSKVHPCWLVVIVVYIGLFWFIMVYWWSIEESRDNDWWFMNSHTTLSVMHPNKPTNNTMINVVLMILRHCDGMLHRWPLQAAAGATISSSHASDVVQNGRTLQGAFWLQSGSKRVKSQHIVSIFRGQPAQSAQSAQVPWERCMSDLNYSLPERLSVSKCLVKPSSRQGMDQDQGMFWVSLELRRWIGFISCHLIILICHLQDVVKSSRI